MTDDKLEYVSPYTPELLGDFREKAKKELEEFYYAAQEQEQRMVKWFAEQRLKNKDKNKIKLLEDLMTEYETELHRKFETGEYLHTWNGYEPFYAGCFSGYRSCLGGEDKFRHCYGLYSRIFDVDWWDKKELDKLTSEEQEELLSILKRNKAFDEYAKTIIPELAKLLNVKPYQVYRVLNKDLYNFLNLVHSKANREDMLEGNYYDL